MARRSNVILKATCMFHVSQTDKCGIRFCKFDQSKSGPKKSALTRIILISYHGQGQPGLKAHCANWNGLYELHDILLYHVSTPHQVRKTRSPIYRGSPSLSHKFRDEVSHRSRTASHRRAWRGGTSGGMVVPFDRGQFHNFENDIGTWPRAACGVIRLSVVSDELHSVCCGDRPLFVGSSSWHIHRFGSRFVSPHLNVLFFAPNVNLGRGRIGTPHVAARPTPAGSVLVLGHQTQHIGMNGQPYSP